MASSPLKQVAEVQPFKVRKSKIAGLGAFATRNIRKGERIAEYLGERVSHKVADARYDDHAEGAHHTFLFSVNRSVVIDAYVNGNDARYINHSCDGNCESEIEGGRVFIDAIRNIRKGDELTYDYAYGRDGSETPEEETGLYGCRCGSRKCRGTILEEISERRRRQLYGPKTRRKRSAKHSVAREAARRNGRTGRATSGAKSKARKGVRRTTKTRRRGA